MHFAYVGAPKVPRLTVSFLHIPHRNGVSHRVDAYAVGLYAGYVRTYVSRVMHTPYRLSEQTSAYWNAPSWTQEPLT
jgi:hypothetical protein